MLIRHFLINSCNFGCAGSLVLRGLALVAASRGSSLVVVLGLLAAVASFYCRARALSTWASVVAAQGSVVTAGPYSSRSGSRGTQT